MDYREKFHEKLTEAMALTSYVSYVYEERDNISPEIHHLALGLIIGASFDWKKTSQILDLMRYEDKQPLRDKMKEFGLSDDSINYYLKDVE